jgi:hypothetical protein
MVNIIHIGEKMQTIKNPYKEIFIELEQGFLDHSARIEESNIPPYEFDDETFRACCRIFFEAMMVRLFQNLENQDISLPEKCQIATQCGLDISALVEKYTGINTYKMY